MILLFQEIELMAIKWSLMSRGLKLGINYD